MEIFFAATGGGGGEDGPERRRRVPNGRGPRLRQRGRSSPVSQSALAPSPRALAPQGLAPGAVCSGFRGSSPPAGGRTGPAGCLGPLRPGPARTMQGEGCRKRGVRSAQGALGFPASFPPTRLSVTALGGPLPALLVSARLGLETQLSVHPALGCGKGGEAGGFREVCELEVGEEEGVGLRKQVWEFSRAPVYAGRACGRQVWV